MSERAKSLRKNPTDAEMRLWSHLRRRQIAGIRFRRQVSIGPYVVDFASHEAKLVIEVDGGQHDLGSARETARTRRIQEDGFRVIRFWNSEVLGNFEGVVLSIEAELTSHPPPQPSPTRGEGEIGDTEALQ
ncbi:MAG: endonuclease domain-containing protein [Kiloniellales bacterium]|nr:endonuclease domain-containing protein [Kiloniellales bacterium]